MRIRLRGPGHAANLLAELNRCRQARQFCDVFLQVGKRTFAAHRAVLACAGTYFLSLFARAGAPPTAAFPLEFISPASLEKVLTFIYTGEILTDLIDVGVLYETAERLGVAELVRACHATFPDLRPSADGKASCCVDLSSDANVLAAAVSTRAAASASCSSATSCSSLSSSAAPTPAAAPWPLFPAGAALSECGSPPRVVPVKAEDVQSHAGYGQMDYQSPGGHAVSTSSQADGALSMGGLLAAGPAGELKSETELEEAGGPPCPSSSSFLDCSAPQEACPPASPGGATATMEHLQGQERMFQEVGGAEEEQWRRLAVDIIELSDEENFMEEGEEDDVVCLENGGGGASGSQVGPPDAGLLLR